VKRAILAACFLTAAAWGAFSHPHMFMDTRVEVVCEQDRLKGFWITWRFDKVFTASILMDFDRDANRRLSPSEVENIREEAFSNLVHYHYFIYIRSPRGAHRPQSVEGFSAYMEGQRIHYRFFVPYRLSVGAEGVDVNLAVYDETFFCAIDYEKLAPVMFAASSSIQGSYEIREDRGIQIEYAANDGSQASTYPRQIVLHLRRVS
jgi:ABC-type uncharacterized transport system substrate-binding protein